MYKFQGLSIDISYYQERNGEDFKSNILNIVDHIVQRNFKHLIVHCVACWWHHLYFKSWRHFKMPPPKFMHSINFGQFIKKFFSPWDNKQLKGEFTQILPQQLTGNSYQFCDNVHGFAAGLRSHMKVHGVNINAKEILK